MPVLSDDPLQYTVMEPTVTTRDIEANILNQKKLRALFLLLALSLHAVIEGLALGLQSGMDKAVVVFIALISHKGMEAFAVGFKSLESNNNKKLYIIKMLGFASSTPIGIAIGAVSMATLTGTVAHRVTSIGSAFAAGSFIEISSTSLIEEFRCMLCVLLFMNSIGCFIHQQDMCMFDWIHCHECDWPLGII